MGGLLSIVDEGKVALCGFTAGVLASSYFLLRDQLPSAVVLGGSLVLVPTAISLFVIPLRSKSTRSRLLYSHVASGFLGAVFGTGAYVASTQPSLFFFGCYTMLLSFFHISEYIMTALYNSHKLSNDSFLLNHSVEYHAALAAGLVEFFVEYYFFPGLKTCFVPWIGLALCLAGETVRKLAMNTAKSNFSHIVATEKAAGHQLVTDGIYRISRHPSYMGWFWWSVGTQILLCNPICIAGYAYASYRFFDERVREEEQYLIAFFKMDYIDYQQRVGTGIPFVKGFHPDLKR